MFHQLFDHLSNYHGSFVDHADGSATFLDPMGSPAFHIHEAVDHGTITNAFGVVMDSFHNTATGVQHFDGLGTPTLTEHFSGGKIDFLDAMNQHCFSFDPMTSSVSNALGSLRFRIT